MTHCLNTLANLIQQYIWLAPVLALLGGLVTSFTPCSDGHCLYWRISKK